MHEYSSYVNSKVMNEMANLASSINGSSAELTIGGAVGILVRETEPADVQEVSFAYLSPNDSINVGALLLFYLNRVSTE